MVGAVAIVAQTPQGSTGVVGKTEYLVENGAGGVPANLYEDIEVFRRILNDALTPFRGQGFPLETIQSIAFSPDGRLLASSHGDTVVRWWDPNIAFSPDGKLLASVNADAVVRLWDSNTGKQVHLPGHPPLFSDVYGVEGIHLPGYGLVYSVTMPPPAQPLRGKAGKPVSRPPTQWERVRNEVRGEKPKSDDRTVTKDEPALIDSVLRVMAENGRHLVPLLKEKDTLTVAISLRSMSNCIQCHVAGGLSPKTGQSGGGQQRPGPAKQFGPNTGNPSAATTESYRKYVEAIHRSARDQKTLESQRVDAANYANLGDMRMRQGRPNEAADAYQKALALYQQLMAADAKFPLVQNSNVRNLTVLAEGYGKLADALVAQGKHAEAQSALERFARYAPRSMTTEGLAAFFEIPKSAQLPSKILISATKSLLEQVGSGKMNLEEFKNSVAIEEHSSASAPPPAQGKSSRENSGSQPDKRP
jgi:hypothetical protein